MKKIKIKQTEKRNTKNPKLCRGKNPSTHPFSAGCHLDAPRTPWCGAPPPYSRTPCCSGRRSGWPRGRYFPAGGIQFHIKMRKVLYYLSWSLSVAAEVNRLRCLILLLLLAVRHKVRVANVVLGHLSRTNTVLLVSQFNTARTTLHSTT